MRTRFEGERSEAADFLFSESWKLALARGFLPAYRRWAKAILFDQNLPPAKREAFIFALAEYKKGLTTIYEELKVEVPVWLQKELEIVNGA